MTILEPFFRDRLISMCRWAARSPNLFPPEFFLWDFLKDSVYGELKDAFETAQGYHRRHEQKNVQKYAETDKCLSSNMWQSVPAPAVIVIGTESFKSNARNESKNWKNCLFTTF